MEREQFELQVVAYLSGRMEKQEQLSFQAFLKNKPEYQLQLEQMQLTWEHIDNLGSPEPSEKMDVRFYEMLSRSKEKQEKKAGSLGDWIQSLLAQIWRPQLAYGILLLGIGLSVGLYMNSRQFVEQEKSAVVSNAETEEVREKLVLTLLEQPSANKRLQAVSEATKLNSATERILTALFTTLNNDPNTNVRLAAVESLARYVEKPEVRMALIQSINKQDSPLVQIALADLMVKLQEKSSVESIRQLLEQPNIDTTVKQKLEQSINHII